ncbi:MAG: transposase [Myxococcales bacterium]|nr:transposase [Myxococcales bacterium]
MHLWVFSVAGFIQRSQQQVIEYLLEENRVLREQLNGRRLKRYLIHDRDPLFTQTFTKILVTAGVKTVKLPARGPNLNAYAERFVRSIRHECLRRVIPLGEQHLRQIVAEYVEHYHLERTTRASGYGSKPGTISGNCYGALAPRRMRSVVARMRSSFASSIVRKRRTPGRGLNGKNERERDHNTRMRALRSASLTLSGLGTSLTDRYLNSGMSSSIFFFQVERRPER